MRTEDGYIIYRCLNGEPGAYGLLVDKYKAGVYSLAYSKLRNFHDAEDVAQEVFIRAYENLHKLRRWDSFASWLSRIASSLCKQWLRAHSRRPDREFIEDKDPGMFEERAMDSYREEHAFTWLHEALDSLPEMHRQALTLHYLGGMTSYEIARFVGASPAAVRKRLSKGRSLLKTEILATISAGFQEQKLSASFTLRITELVKHIRVKPLPRLAELPWGVSAGTVILAIILSLGIFDGVQDLMDRQMEAAVSADTGEILVDIVEQTPNEHEGDTSMLSNRKITVFSVITALLTLLSSNTMGQTEWTKYEDPVLSPDPSGWDGLLVVRPSVLFEHGEYKMWYTGGGGGYSGRIGYATYSEEFGWRKYEKNPVLGPTSSNWDQRALSGPSVVYAGNPLILTEYQRVYKMWYTGISDSGSLRQIGYAESVDGANWIKYVGNPVLSPGGGWEGSQVRFPNVILDDSPMVLSSSGPVYKMWYTGSLDLGYAESADGVNWIKYAGNPVLEKGVIGEWDSDQIYGPSVVFAEGEYSLWYRGMPGGTTRGSIGYAKSVDGVDWTKYNDPGTTTSPYIDSDPVMEGTSGTWDELSLEVPFVLYEPGIYKMWYVGCDTGVEYHIGYATSVIPDQPPVADAGGPYSVGEGSSITVIASGSDPDDDPLTFAWDLDNDGTFGTPGQSVTFSAAGLDGPDSHPITVQVTDTGGLSATDQTTVSVLDVKPTASFNWSPEPRLEGSLVSFTDKSTSPVDAIVTWSWDFAGLDTSNDQNPSFTFMDDGTYIVTLTVTDDDGSTDDVQHEVEVANAPPVVETTVLPSEPVYEGSLFSLELATFADAGILDTHTAIIDWGDDTIIESGVVSEANGHGTVSGSHTYADDGEYNVKVTVTDDLDSSSATLTIGVSNVAPVVGIITATLDPVEVATPVTASANFTDPGILDTHTAEWNWGDGNTTAGIVNETSGSGSVTGSHPYTDAGVYTIKLTVTDKDGDFSESVFQYVVVYDPGAGFVTGGGWIDSPSGAYTPENEDDPDLTGKANFGFVSRYKKGADVPTGNTQFVFHIADLNFHSTEYDWLVVAGDKAKFKGWGDVNGEDSYQFMLTATDGDDGVNKFRIKIWDADGVLYDNKHGSADESSDAQVIGGGSIVIHKDKQKAAPSLASAETSLLAAYPNPANPDVWIPYRLSDTSAVTIRIHDSAGRLVRTLDLGTKSAGFYTDKIKAAHWDGTNESGEPIASGLYFYTIQAGEFAATRKMLILK
ncbi:sigma-70 family RNA polymerase sigma factor [Candidatus Poribacteria bacterium]